MDVLYIRDYKPQPNEYLVGADSFKTFYKKIRDHEPLLEALQEASDVSVDYLDAPDTMTDFPQSVEELAERDTLIISDLSRGTLEPHFHPDSIPERTSPGLSTTSSRRAGARVLRRVDDVPGGPRGSGTGTARPSPTPSRSTSGVYTTTASNAPRARTPRSRTAITP
jgi:hypothetical protein